MDATDCRIINGLQGGFPVCARPYAEAAAALGIGEADLIERLARLLDDGILSRFGPLFHAERLGGGLTLAAMAVPADRFDEVAVTVNGFGEGENGDIYLCGGTVSAPGGAGNILRIVPAAP